MVSTEQFRENLSFGKIEIIEKLEELSDELLDELVDCAQSVFDSESSAGDFLNRRVRFRNILFHNGKIWYVRGENGKIVGFVTSHNSQGTVDFSTVAVRKEYRGQGIFKKLTLAFLSGVVTEKTPSFMFITGNPRVEFTVQKELSLLVEKGLVVSYSVSRNGLSLFGGKPVVCGQQEKSGDKVLDEIYAGLRYESGEVFKVAFNIKYPR